MKTLLKLSSQRATLPVLSAILVQSGIARATNLDMTIFMKTEKPDGFYNGKAPELLSDLDPAEFPEIRVLGESVASLACDLQTLETIYPAISTEQTRYYLNGIAVIPSGFIVATNGHILIKKPCPKIEHPLHTSGIIMPREFVEYVIKACKEEKIKVFTLEFFKHGVVVNIGKYRIESKLIDGTYPDVLRVVPAMDKLSHAGALSQKDMVMIEKECKRIARAKNEGKNLALKINGTGKATHLDIEYPISLKFERDTGFSSSYMAAMPSGNWYMENPSSPARINSGEYIGVIMPLRV